MDEVLVSIHTDAQSAIVQLEAGALDLISVGLPITDMIRRQQDPSYHVLLNDRSGTSWVAHLSTRVCDVSRAHSNRARQSRGGLHVPQVDTPEIAHQVAQAARYAPVGARDMAGLSSGTDFDADLSATDV